MTPVTDSPKQTVAQQVNQADPVSHYLVIAMFTMVVLILTLALYIVAADIIKPAAPRSLAEKQVSMLESVVKEKPTVAKAWADYARALIAVGQYSQAQRVLDRGAAAAGKDSSEILLERARLARAKHQRALAIKLTHETIDSARAARDKELAALAKKHIVPDKRVVKGDIIEAAAIMQGELYSQEGDWKNAVKAFDLAIAEDPTSADTLIERGAAYLQLKQADAAAADFRAALRYVPDSAQASEGLAEALKAGAK